jgi:hypothetical protein
MSRIDELATLIEEIEDDLWDLDWFDQKTLDKLERVRNLVQMSPQLPARLDLCFTRRGNRGTTIVIR